MISTPPPLHEACVERPVIHLWTSSVCVTSFVDRDYDGFLCGYLTLARLYTKYMVHRHSHTEDVLGDVVSTALVAESFSLYL